MNDYQQINRTRRKLAETIASFPAIRGHCVELSNMILDLNRIADRLDEMARECERAVPDVTC